jgi:hypothetical protein
MIDILVLITLVFLIAVLFYKQRHPSLEILQAEETQLEAQLPELLEEHQPLVVRGITPPKGLTKDSLEKIPRLAQFSVGGQPLKDVLEHPQMLSGAKGQPVLSHQRRQELAAELSIQVWAEHAWLPKFKETTWTGWAVGCVKTEVLLGGMGMTRTSAVYTCIMPTEGVYTVSILSKDSETFLPKEWKYKYPGDLSPNDTPLVADLKYIDIIVRPGTMICFPPHFVISIKPNQESFTSAAIVEYHEPISLLAKSFSQK